MATTIRELLTVLGVDADTAKVAEFDRALGDAKGNMQSAVKVAALFTGAALAATAAVAGLVVSTMRAGDEIDKGSQKVATSAREYQVLSKMADLGGASVSELQAGLRNLNAEKDRATEAGRDYIEVAGGMRIGLRDAGGELLSQTGIWKAVADQVAATADEQERLTIASAAFGSRAGGALVAALAEGGGALDALEAKMLRNGQLMSDDLVKGSALLTDQLGDVRDIMGGLRNTIAEALMPVVNGLLGRFLAWYEANGALIRQRLERWAERLGRGMRWLGDQVAWVDEVVRKRLGGWERILMAVAAAIAVVVAALVAFAAAKAFLAIKAALAALLAGFSVIGAVGAAALALVTAAVLLVTAQMTALIFIVQDLLTWLRGGESVIGAFVEANYEAEGALGALSRGIVTTIDWLAALLDLAQAVGGWLAATFGPQLRAEVDQFIAALEVVWGWLGRIADALAPIIDGWGQVGAMVTGGVRGLAASIRGEDAREAAAAMGPAAAAARSGSQTNNSVVQEVRVEVGAGADSVDVQEAVRRGLEQANRNALGVLGGGEV